jgi:hypothetical protein
VWFWIGQNELDICLFPFPHAAATVTMISATRFAACSGEEDAVRLWPCVCVLLKILQSGRAWYYLF